jgi:DNA-binding sugar fermentation-stimulating protein
MSALLRGVLLERYKRFLARVRLDDGTEVTASVLNPGRMTGGDEGAPAKGYAVPNESAVYLAAVDRGAKAKHPFRWIIATEPSTGALVCVHTLAANRLIGEALESRAPCLMEAIGEALSDVEAEDNAMEQRAVPRFHFHEVERETSLPRQDPDTERRRRENAPPDTGAWQASTTKTRKTSRCDFCLDHRIFIEVKSVTMRGSAEGLVLFPDAVSDRASRHLQELASIARGSAKYPRARPEMPVQALVIFVVQRSDPPRALCPAESIDPAFAVAMRHAACCGVRFLCLWVKPSVTRMVMDAGSRPSRTTAWLRLGKSIDSGVSLTGSGHGVSAKRLTSRDIWIRIRSLPQMLTKIVIHPCVAMQTMEAGAGRSDPSRATWKM